MIFRNTAYDFVFNVGIPDRTWDVFISKDGGEYIVPEGTVEAMASNCGYIFHATDNDMDANILNILVVENNDPTYIVGDPLKYESIIVTEDPLTFNGAAYLNNLEDILIAIYNRIGGEVWTYTMYTNSSSTVPLVGCTVRMSLDYSGDTVIGEKVSDSEGKTRWLVERGRTYYMWRSMTGYSFDDPDEETIDLVGDLSVMAFASQEEEIVNQFLHEESKEPEHIKTVDWSYTVFTDRFMDKPLSDCIVRITRDRDGYDVIGEKITDSLGIVKWELESGEYYAWRFKEKYSFINPDKQVVK